MTDKSTAGSGIDREKSTARTKDAHSTHYGVAMPTGYTADVADGKVKDFRTFALRCARAFGATIMQRDDPADELPKHREPTDYYTKELDRARAELVRIDRMTDAEAELAATEDYEADLAARVKHRRKKVETRKRYEVMLEDVKAWEPPTEKHVEFKDFMVKQLTESIDFDCEGTFREDDPRRLTGKEWRASRRRALADDIQRYLKHEAEELERCNGANAWIDALYESLDTTKVSA